MKINNIKNRKGLAAFMKYLSGMRVDAITAIENTASSPIAAQECDSRIMTKYNSIPVILERASSLCTQDPVSMLRPSSSRSFIAIPLSRRPAAARFTLQ
ncbi:hypothetical protein D3C86_1958320 [compost metagenome]